MDSELSNDFHDFIDMTKNILVEVSKTELNHGTRGLRMLRGVCLNFMLFHYFFVHHGMTPFALYYLLDSASVVLLQIIDEDFDINLLPELDFELGVTSSCTNRADNIYGHLSIPVLPGNMKKWVLKNHLLKLKSLENLQNPSKFYMTMAVYLTNETDLFDVFSRVVEEHVGIDSEHDLLKWFAGIEYCLVNYVDALHHIYTRASFPDDVSLDLLILLAKMNCEFSSNALTFQFITLSRLALFEKACKDTEGSYKNRLAAVRIEFLEQNRTCYLTPTLESIRLILYSIDDISDDLEVYWAWAKNKNRKSRKKAMVLHASLLYVQNVLVSAAKIYVRNQESTPLGLDLILMIAQLNSIANAALLKITTDYLPENIRKSITPFLIRASNEKKIETKMLAVVYDLVEAEISKIYPDDPVMACAIFKFIELNRLLVALLDMTVGMKELMLLGNADLSVLIISECLDYLSTIFPENIDFFCSISLGSSGSFINASFVVISRLFTKMKISDVHDSSFFGFLLKRMNENCTDKVFARFGSFRKILSDRVALKLNKLALDESTIKRITESESESCEISQNAKTLSAIFNAKKSPYKLNAASQTKSSSPASNVQEKHSSKVKNCSNRPLEPSEIQKSVPSKISKRSQRKKNKERKEFEERRAKELAEANDAAVPSDIAAKFEVAGQENFSENTNEPAEIEKPSLVPESKRNDEDAVVPTIKLNEVPPNDMAIVPVKALTSRFRLKIEKSKKEKLPPVKKKSKNSDESQIASVPMNRSGSEIRFNIQPSKILSGSKGICEIQNQVNFNLCLELKDGMASYWSKLAPILREEYKVMQMVEQQGPPKAIRARAIEKYEEPKHHLVLAKQAGFASVNIDPRDYLMGLIIVGQRIWTQVIQPLFTVIQRFERELHWIQAFKESVESFEQELEMLNEIEPELLQQRLNEAGFDFEVMMKYLSYYKRRNIVCHPLQFKSLRLQQNIASRHLTVFEELAIFDDDFIHATRNVLKAKDEIFVGGIERGFERPLELLSPEYTEKALAVIGIHEMYRIDDISIVRNGYAHKEVSDSTYQAYLLYLFKDSPDYELLCKLKR